MRSRVFEPSPIALLGGVLALISCFVAWDGYDDSFYVPLQLGRRIGWDNLSAGNIEAGPYLAGAGGLLALLAPTGLWPFTRLRRRPPPE